MKKSFYCSQDDLALRHTAIAWLGSLLRDQFPSLQPLGGEVTPSGILYRMTGEGYCDDYNDTMLPVLNERLKVRLLDMLRDGDGDRVMMASREMLRSNALAFLRHQKEYLLARLLKAEGEAIDEHTLQPASPLLSLLMIGSHIEAVPQPHLFSIELLRHLHVLSITSEEKKVLGKLRQVWVFHAQIASSSRESKQWIKKWSKQSPHKKTPDKKQKAKQEPKNTLWVPMDENKRVWTIEGMTVRERILAEWRTECVQRNIPEIVTQGPIHDEYESLPWELEGSQACIKGLEKGIWCGQQRVGECRTVRLYEDEGWQCSYGTSPECAMYIPNESFAEELDQVFPFLISRITCRSEHAHHSRIVLKIPSSMDSFTRSCTEALKERLSRFLPTDQVHVEICKEDLKESDRWISLCFLLLDEKGGAWAGPSLTLLTRYQPLSVMKVFLPNHKPGRRYMLLAWRAFGVLERWIQWSQLWGLFEKL